ncbi:thyrotroph embryonic factor-like [Denticeps clupeoides]|nr:thyrotroph embryonic factor-like [Denticeps clupeoides]
MSVEATQAEPLPFVLKKIMEIPPPNILEDGDDGVEKKKLCSSQDGEAPGGTGDGASVGVSAALTPAIWNKTIPYDGENFHLEYMDLDEFLLENGLPVALEEELQKSLKEEPGSEEDDPPPSSPIEVLSASESQPVVEEAQKDEEPVSGSGDAADGGEDIKADGSRRTSAPVDPEEIEVDVNFQPDPTDLVLSSVPGGELFNPRKHRFSEEELKPQPMIKKAKKVFVPDEKKDEKYWSRRKKNNMAAKRSRDARRLKENQITVRAAFLERENAALRQEVAELRKDCGRCKNIVSRYEAKYGPL